MTRNDLVLKHDYGVKLRGDQTYFSVWSPTTKDIKLRLYKSAKAVRYKTYQMIKNNNNIYELTLNENLEGQFYTYLVDGEYEVIDPYVHSTNGNSSKGAIIDARDVELEGFLTHNKPQEIDPLEAVIYELHIKDFSIDQKMPFKYKGKYLAFTEKGLTYKGEKIGIDHLVELGVTHVHLLPVYDFITVNDFDSDDYNWGYDPFLYNSLEGSYSMSPDDPKSRILEFKKLVMALHEAGLRVVLDVVYNHTYFGGTSNFNRLMEGVFHRMVDGHYGNGSGCGNELKTEDPFVGHFILNSLKFWLETYQVDGFRFDLMGLYDCDFVEVMSRELHQIKPDILLYGEPWTGGPSALNLDQQFLKGKQVGLKVALFNDDFRNAIKGSNDGEDSAFIGKGKFRKDDVYAGLFGSMRYSDSIVGFAKSPSETINYVSSHDNLILMDKFSKAFHYSDFEEKQNMNALALSMVILALGIPFIQSGTEFLRSKYGHHNTYNSGYYINRMHFSYKKNHKHVFDYIKTLIDFRKSQAFYKLTDAKCIHDMITILPSETYIVDYTIKSPIKGDYPYIRIIFNGKMDGVLLDNDGSELLIDGALYHDKHVLVEKDKIHLPKLSTVILIKK